MARQSELTVEHSGLVDETGICVGEDEAAD